MCEFFDPPEEALQYVDEQAAENIRKNADVHCPNEGTVEAIAPSGTVHMLCAEHADAVALMQMMMHLGLIQ
jgi:hypothetical protein